MRWSEKKLRRKNSFYLFFTLTGKFDDVKVECFLLPVKPTYGIFYVAECVKETTKPLTVKDLKINKTWCPNYFSDCYLQLSLQFGNIHCDFYTGMKYKNGCSNFV